MPKLSGFVSCVIFSFLGVYLACFIAATYAASPEIEPLEQYRLRRERLAGTLNGVVVLFAAPASDLVEFQQEDNFYYLTGFGEPEAILLLDGREGRADEHLFIPSRNPREERWTGIKLGPGPEAERATGIASVEALEDFDATFSELAGPNPSVYTLMTEDQGLERLRSLTPGAVFQDAGPAIADLRLLKAETELVLLRKAIDITTMAHANAATAIRPGAPEYEVEGLIEYTFRRNGAERPAFPSIVGSGPYSTILHYDRNNRVMQAGDLVVVDIGAEYSGYAADVTRTYPVSGQFTERQKEIYEIVLDAQKAALDRIRPGVRIGGPNGVDAAARDYIEGHGYGQYFIHGTSHYLGLYVHDVGDTSRPLEPGMVLTVEPGIYLPEESLGVRIEDDVLVTPGGYELLSNFPREIEEIEDLMAGSRTSPVRN